MLLDDEFDSSEYFGVKNKLASFGCTIVNTATKESVESQTGDIITVDILFSEADEDDYDCIYIPGGLAPSNLIEKQAVLTFIQNANTKGIVLAAICSGPVVFAAAGIVEGRNVTGHTSVQKELVEAGGNFIGGSCVRDDNLITANNPYMDLSCIEITKALGYYEDEPPEIEAMTYAIKTGEASKECYLEMEITDYFGVQQVKIMLYKYENNRTTKTLEGSVELQDYEQNDQFNGTITGLESGEYCIALYMQDVLRNEYLNESILELNLLATQNNPIVILTIGEVSVGIFSTIYIIRKKKARENYATYS